jgi:zinc protease
MTTTHLSRFIALAAGLALVSGCKPKASTDVPESTVTTEPSTATPGGPATADKTPARVYPEPPEPGARKPVNFPDVETFVAANGLPVYVVQNHEVPTVTAQLVVRCGSMDEEFVAPFTAAMLGEGTTTRSKAKIDDAIEFVGGSLGAGGGLHTSTVWSHVLAKDAKLALVLMADEVLHPAFPAEALEKLKQQAKTSLSFTKSQPAALASVLFDHVVYPEGHPYGRLFPSPADIDAIDVAALKKFHGTFYTPGNSYLVLAGDITPAEAKPLVERAFGAWKKSTTPLPPNPLNKFTEYRLPGELVIDVVDRPASAQTEIRVGNLAIARSHEDWLPLQVANAVLGDDATGRLFMDIREELGLTYGIYSSIAEGQAPGTFVIETRTRTDTTGAMLAAIFGHLGRIRKEAPTNEEIASAKEKLAGRFPLEIETAHDIAGKLRDSLTYGLPLDYWQGYWDEYAKVGQDDVQRVAKSYMHAMPHVVLVGDAKVILPQVQKTLPGAKIVRWNTELEREK